MYVLMMDKEFVNENRMASTDFDVYAEEHFLQGEDSYLSAEDEGFMLGWLKAII